MTQYDHIALDYQLIGDTIPYRGPEWHSLRTRLGDLTGCSVLDLGCGDGMSTRRIKGWGAASIVGVDISEEMIKLARDTDDEKRVGNAYHVADVATMGRIGEFDRVTASYLLHYARNREQLLQMV